MILLFHRNEVAAWLLRRPKSNVQYVHRVPLNLNSCFPCILSAALTNYSCPPLSLYLNSHCLTWMTYSPLISYKNFQSISVLRTAWKVLAGTFQLFLLLHHINSQQALCPKCYAVCTFGYISSITLHIKI